MTHYEVVFSELAARQLEELYAYIADRSGPVPALDDITRIETYCRGLATFPARGRSRDDLRPGLRTVGFERRVTIAFAITSERVVILQILYGGQDAEARLRNDVDGRLT